MSENFKQNKVVSIIFLSTVHLTLLESTDLKEMEFIEILLRFLTRSDILRTNQRTLKIFL